MEIRPDDIDIDIPSRSPSRLGLRRPLFQRHFSFCAHPLDSTAAEDDDAFSLGNAPACPPMATSKTRTELEESGIDDSSSEEDEDYGESLEDLESHIIRLQFSNSDPALSCYGPTPDSTEDRLFSSPSDSCGDFFFGTSSIPDHGLSYSALRFVKKMWSVRQDEWESWNYYQAEALKSAAAVYDGLAETPETPGTINHSGHDHPIPRSMLDVSSPLTPLLPESPAHVTSSEAPIFPRFGTISRIRDPIDVTIDRAFCTMPIHTAV